MKTKSKTKKKDTEETLRKRITLSIDPDHHAFIKNAGINASRFFDSAINALKKEYFDVRVTNNDLYELR